MLQRMVVLLTLLVPSATLGAQTFASTMCAVAVAGIPDARQTSTIVFREPDGTERHLNLVAWGVPAFRIGTTASTRSQRESLSETEASESAMCIVESQGRYFWFTREMTEMARSDSGGFVTYHALNGSGYVRLLNRQGREQADAVRDNPLLREQFAARYVEHMMIGFNTITYIGF